MIKFDEFQKKVIKKYGITVIEKFNPYDARRHWYEIEYPYFTQMQQPGKLPEEWEKVPEKNTKDVIKAITKKLSDERFRTMAERWVLEN